MSETLWTPGPWHVRTTSFGFVDAADGLVAYMSNNPQETGAGRHRPEREANARLIAAAPELVAALEELIGKVVFRTADGDRLCFVCGTFGDPDERSNPMPHSADCEVAAHVALLARIKGESNE